MCNDASCAIVKVTLSLPSRKASVEISNEESIGKCNNAFEGTSMQTKKMRPLLAISPLDAKGIFSDLKKIWDNWDRTLIAARPMMLYTRCLSWWNPWYCVEILMAEVDSAVAVMELDNANGDCGCELKYLLRGIMKCRYCKGISHYPKIAMFRKIVWFSSIDDNLDLNIHSYDEIWRVSAIEEREMEDKNSLV